MMLKINENKGFFWFYFFMGFQLNFPNIISQTLVVGCAKVLSQEMQFVWSILMELFPHIILIA